MAATITDFIDRIQFGTDDTHQIAIGSSAYAVCNTAANVSAKVATIPGFTLNTGTTIHINFTYNNTATNPTLEINSTGAKSIKQYGTTAAGTDDETTGWQAGAVLTLTYNGTNWVRDSGHNINTQEDYGNITTDGKLDDASTLVITDANKIITNGPEISSTINIQDQDTMFLREDGTWAVPSYTEELDWSDINNVPNDFSPSSHTHGNISNNGELFSNDSVNVHNGDALVIVDTSLDPTTQLSIEKIARSSIEFQVSNPPIEDYALSKSGTWASVVNSIGGHSGVVTLADLGLASALRFVGVATATISDGGHEDPVISGYTFGTNGASAQEGDIVVDSSSLREYLWDGSQWILLGLTLSTSYDSSLLTATNSSTYNWVADIEQHTDGTISVIKEQINILPMEHGGTGTDQFNKNEVIISNNINNESYATQLTSRAFIDATLTNNLPTARTINISDNFMTEAAIYAGLPTINNAHNYNLDSEFYIPTTGGLTGQILVGAGATNAPIWSVAARLDSAVSDVANTAAETILTLGNNGGLATTNDHSEGKIVIYSSNTQAHTISGLSTATAYSHIIPNASGYFVQVGANSTLTNNDQTGVVGTPEQPVYVGNQGIIKPITYTINRIYYGAATNSFTYSNHFIDNDQIFINDPGTTAHTETLYVNGDTTINGILNILDTTDVDLTTSPLEAAVIISGGIYIAKQIYAGDTITTTGDIIGIGTSNSTSNLSITGTSTLSGNVGIGCDPDNRTTGDIHRLQIEGSVGFLLNDSSSTLTAAHIDSDSTTINNTSVAYITFKPENSGTGYIGTSSNLWKEGYFKDSITINNITTNNSSSIELNTNAGTSSTLTMQTDTSAELAMETTHENSSYQTKITLSGDKTSIVFDAPSTDSDWNLDSDVESNTRIFKIHNNSTTYLKGADNGFELATRLYINSAIPNSDPYTLYVGGPAAIQGDLIPVQYTESSVSTYGSLGSASNPWKTLYLGTGGDYGDEYLPVYWHNGLPTPATNIIQIATFSFTSNSSNSVSATINTNTSANSKVVKIVVEESLTSHISSLQSEISWNILNNAIVLSAIVNGTVGGYILYTK